MHYLLVGNANDASVSEKAANADIIIQINRCLNCNMIPLGKTDYVFIVNSGGLLADTLNNMPMDKLARAQIILSRNPTFYFIKKWLLRALRIKGGYLFNTCKMPKGLKYIKISFMCNLMLDYRMIFKGMPLGYMPSTGMIAYDWLKCEMVAGDTLTIAGFTFEGWERHPWNIEKQLIKPISK